jgi:diguanylate cyclase (GGDEF)-like protein
MKVSKTSTVTPSGWDAERDGPQGDKREKGEKKASDEASAPDGLKNDAGHEPVRDDISVMGIPLEMLTPEVEKALEALMKKTEVLRQEHDLLLKREREAVHLSETHSFLPVLSRRAFERELNYVLNNADCLATSPSLMGFHVLGAEKIRRLGRSVLDLALKHVCSVLKDHLHLTDILGSLGGDDFAAILLATDSAEAVVREKALMQAIKDHPFHWAGKKLEIEIAIATLELKAQAKADAVLAAVDHLVMAKMEM